MADKMMWAYLIHLGMNMWQDRDTVFPPNHIPSIGDPRYSEKLRCDRKTWTDVIDHLPQAGIDTVVIDIGEGIRYESHPELAVEGSWSAAELKKELDRMRSLGLTPIPKLNFSACHDAWLGEYSHMLSTQTYYGVCGEVRRLRAVRHPVLHLEMDEENYDNQRKLRATSVIRGEKLWWQICISCSDRCERTARARGLGDYYWYKQGLSREMPNSRCSPTGSTGARGQGPATGSIRRSVPDYVVSTLWVCQVLTSPLSNRNSDRRGGSQEEDFIPD